MILPFIPLVVGLWATAASMTYRFRPDNHTTWKNTRIPSLINLSEDQNSGSYWSIAFVTATTGQQFLIIHHQYAAFCKSSVLDLQSLKYWKKTEDCEITSETKTVTSDSVSIQFPDFAIEATAPDKISQLQLSASSRDYDFTLDVDSTTSKVLLNGGNGVIAWGPNGANCTHWSIPAARTSGTLKLGKKRALELDPDNSFTWYDHQVTRAAPNFSWFEVHFPNLNVRVSIWVYGRPDSNDAFRYATVRVDQEVTLVLPFVFEEDLDSTWVSPESNRNYPQRWTLKFDNGDYLKIQSVKEEQEIMTDAWTGFVTVDDSNFMGKTYGFGVGDVIYT
ncbi:hypothetical protein QQX98_003785 [Neonectria punicea]|uniref:AttH domain-containing protein n=1 Tax=Neonectria punicea TaxID=979145 RepID=A0ABR1HC77_9HYPO